MKKSLAEVATIPFYPCVLQRAVNNGVVTITVNAIPIPEDAQLTENILYKPMCYLQKDQTSSGYTFYAFVNVPAGSIVKSEGSDVVQINATNFITLKVTPPHTGVTDMLLFVEVTGLPAPAGFQFSMVRLTVIGNDENDENVPRGGEGKTALGYGDADELPA